MRTQFWPDPCALGSNHWPFDISALAQLMVAGMLEEARAAESTRDFISKCCIALKECRESHVRLRVHEATQVGPKDEAAALRSEAGELVAIISAIVRNSKRNAGVKSRSSTKSRALKQARIPNS